MTAARDAIANLQMSDLFPKCEKCDGEGSYKETRGKRGTFGSQSISVGPCDACRSAGGHLTETGKTLQEFFLMLQRNPLLRGQ